MMACWTVLFFRRPTISLDTPVYAFITNNEFSRLGNICLFLSAFLMNRTRPAAMVHTSNVDIHLCTSHAVIDKPHTKITLPQALHHSYPNIVELQKKARKSLSNPLCPLHSASRATI
jgi:hypothetical protein